MPPGYIESASCNYKDVVDVFFEMTRSPAPPRTGLRLPLPVSSGRYGLLLGALLDSDLTYLLFHFRCRHRNLQNAVVQLRLSLIRLRSFGKRNGAVELAVAPLVAVIPFLFHFVFALALAFDDQSVVGHLDLHFFFLQAG